MNLIRKNFVYNNLFGLTNVLVPLVIFPYISRVFGPVGLGKVSFAISLTATFVIVGSLGIPIYGIREIAKVKENKTLLSKTFFEICSIQTIWLVFTLVLYFIWISLSKTFEGDLIIKIASFFHIVGIIGLTNWFYQGVENYHFITIINFGIKGLTILLLYTLISSRDQYWLYYGILVFSTLLGGIVSIMNTKKYVTTKIQKLNLKRHIKPITILFGTQLAIGIYANMDIVFLKYFSNDEQVGFYTPAIRLVKVALLVITALGTVLIPKISKFVEEGKIEECNSIIKKSIKFVLLLSFPIIGLLYAFAFDAIQIFAGEHYVDSVVLLKSLTPLIFLIGMNNIFGLQVLVPFHKEKQLFYSVGIGAIISIVLNIILIPKLQSLGTVYSILTTEFVITCLTLFFAVKTLKFDYPLKTGVIYLSLSLIFIPISILVNYYLDSFLYIIINTICCLSIYVAGLVLLKERFFIETILKPILKLKK